MAVFALRADKNDPIHPLLTMILASFGAFHILVDSQVEAMPPSGARQPTMAGHKHNQGVVISIKETVRGNLDGPEIPKLLVDHCVDQIYFWARKLLEFQTQVI